MHDVGRGGQLLHDMMAALQEVQDGFDRSARVTPNVFGPKTTRFARGPRATPELLEARAERTRCGLLGDYERRESRRGIRLRPATLAPRTSDAAVASSGSSAWTTRSARPCGSQRAMLARTAPG